MMFFMIVCMVFKLILMITSWMFANTISSGVYSFMLAIDNVLTYAWMLGTFLYIVKHEKEINERK